MAARRHPERGFRTCLGILALMRTYYNVRVDAACRRGMSIRARSVASIRSTGDAGLTDRWHLREDASRAFPDAVRKPIAESAPRSSTLISSPQPNAFNTKVILEGRERTPPFSRADRDARSKRSSARPDIARASRAGLCAVSGRTCSEPARTAGALSCLSRRAMEDQGTFACSFPNGWPPTPRR
jgi:hypothetical protein